jgi:hypothetical protein
MHTELQSARTRSSSVLKKTVNTETFNGLRVAPLAVVPVSTSAPPRTSCVRWHTSALGSPGGVACAKDRQRES